MYGIQYYLLAKKRPVEQNRVAARRSVSRCAFKCDRRFMQDSARPHESILGDDILALRKLLAWVQSNGGSADKLQFAEGSCSRKLVAKSKICGTADEGDTMFSIPTSCLLHPDLAKTDSVYGPAFTSLALEPGVDDRIVLTLFLALERGRGESSKWATYINGLPARIPVPLSWSDSDLKYLEGTRLEHAVKQHRKALQQECEVWAPLLLAHIQQNKYKPVSAEAQALARKALIPEMISWSRSCVWSRAFSLFLNQTKTIALVPLGDMFDHSPDARVEWLTDDTAATFSIRSYEAISEGSEVFNNYGAKCNEELLLGYAFVLEQNKSDNYHLELAASEAFEPNNLSGGTHSVRENGIRDSLLRHYEISSTHCLRIDDPLPGSLLLAAQILSSTPALAYRLCSKIPPGESPAEALATRIPSDDVCTSFRALRSLHLLIMEEMKRLSKRATPDENDCSEVGQGFSAKMSFVYRKSQTHIANMTLTAIKQRARSLLSQLSISIDERHLTFDCDELFLKEKEQYESWLSELGVLNSAVEEISIRSYFGFTDGLRVTSSITEGNFLGSVPSDAIIVASDDISESCSNLGIDAEQAALAATLLRLTLNGEERERYAPFVNWIMCAPVTAAAFNSDVLTVLQGTAVGQGALGLRAEYDEELEMLYEAACLRNDSSRSNLSPLYARARTLVERYAVRLPQIGREVKVPEAGRLAIVPFIGFFPRALEDLVAKLVWTQKVVASPTCEGKWHLELKSLCDLDAGTYLIEPTDGIDEGTQVLEIGTESLCSLMEEHSKFKFSCAATSHTAGSQEDCSRLVVRNSVELLLEPADEDENLRRSKSALLRFMGIGDSHYLSVSPNSEIFCAALLVCSAENQAGLERLRDAWLTAVECGHSPKTQIENTNVSQASRRESNSVRVSSSIDRKSPSAVGEKKNESSVEIKSTLDVSDQSHDSPSGNYLCTFQLAAEALQLNIGIGKNVKRVARTMLRSMIQQLPIPSNTDLTVTRRGTRQEKEASLQRAVALRYAQRQREILEINVEALARPRDVKKVKKRRRSCTT